jgi:hypothetical protein
LKLLPARDPLVIGATASCDPRDLEQFIWAWLRLPPVLMLGASLVSVQKLLPIIVRENEMKERPRRGRIERFPTQGVAYVDPESKAATSAASSTNLASSIDSDGHRFVARVDQVSIQRGILDLGSVSDCRSEIENVDRGLARGSETFAELGDKK